VRLLRDVSRVKATDDVVMLCVPDREVAAVAQALSDAAVLRPGAVVAHTAGALDLQPLGPLQAQGLTVGLLHPLLAVFRKKQALSGHCAVDGYPKARTLLRRLARDAGLTPFDSPPVHRARYHLAAVLAANSVAPLLALAESVLISSGVERRSALPALVSLMESALAACAEAGPVEGLTGPVARGDLKTVQKHLDAMRPDEPRLRGLYVALALAAVDVARGRAAVPPHLDALEALLTQLQR
jgi:predicted short-subunit dehydrogenase-like oxidoreductase (DUF2520 family)